MWSCGVSFVRMTCLSGPKRQHLIRHRDNWGTGNLTVAETSSISDKRGGVSVPGPVVIPKHSCYSFIRRGVASSRQFYLVIYSQSQRMLHRFLVQCPHIPVRVRDLCYDPMSFLLDERLISLHDLDCSLMLSPILRGHEGQYCSTVMAPYRTA